MEQDLDVDKRRKDVEKLIRAKLVPHKSSRRIPLDYLQRDYHEETNESIPYQQFGYSSLVDFLNQIEGLEVYCERNRYFINFQPGENSKHVSELVSKQKDPKRYSRGPVRRAVSSRFHSNSINWNQNTHRGNYNQPSIPDYPYREFDTYNRSRNTMNSNFTSGNTYHSSRNNQNSNQTRENQDFSMNKSSYAEITIDQHVNYLIDVVKHHPQGVKKYELLCKLKTNPHLDYLDMKKLPELIELAGNELMEIEDMVYPASGVQVIRDFQSSPMFSNDSNGIEDFLDDDDFDDEIPLSKTSAPQVLVKSHQTPKYQEEKRSNQYKHQNSPSKVPPIVDDSFKDDDIYSIDDHEDKKDNSDAYTLSNLINQRVLFRLEKLIQNHPEGLTPEQILNLYHKEHNIDLDWRGYGFQRLVDFCANLPDIFRLKGPLPNGDFMLFNAKIPEDEIKLNLNHTKPTLASLHKVYYDSDDDAILMDVNEPSVKYEKPDDVATVNYTCGQIDVAQLYTSSDPNDLPLIYVSVCDSFSPGFFWIQLHSKQEKLKEMMIDLNNEYTNIPPAYKVPKVFLEKGLLVACKYYGEWHRAIIKEVKPTDEVLVFFFDYGTLKTYSWTNIYYLKLKFTYLPAQAIPCGFYDLVPYSGDQWSREANREFVKLTNSTPLWATIVKIDLDKNSMLVLLTNTTTDTDFHIAEYLKEKKLAKNGHVDHVNPDDLSLYREDLEHAEPENKLNKTCENCINENHVPVKSYFELYIMSENIIFKKLFYKLSNQLPDSILKEYKSEFNLEMEEIRNCSLSHMGFKSNSTSETNVKDVEKQLISVEKSPEKNLKNTNVHQKTNHSVKSSPKVKKLQNFIDPGFVDTLPDSNPFKPKGNEKTINTRTPPPLPPRSRTPSVAGDVNENHSEVRRNLKNIATESPTLSNAAKSLATHEVNFNNNNNQICNKNKETFVPQCEIIKDIEVSKNQFVSLIHYNNEIYVSIDQLRSTLTSFSDNDPIFKILGFVSSKFPFITVTKNQHQELFKTLLRSKHFTFHGLNEGLIKILLFPFNKDNMKIILDIILNDAYKSNVSRGLVIGKIEKLMNKDDFAFLNLEK